MEEAKLLWVFLAEYHILHVGNMILRNTVILINTLKIERKNVLQFKVSKKK